MEINIKFPDGTIKQFESGISGFQIADSISHNLAAKIVATEINGKLYDTDTQINEDATILFHTFDS